VHVVVELGRGADISRLVQRLKGVTSRFSKVDNWSATELRWQRGYDSRTVSRSALGPIRAYLDRQEKHNRMPLLARWSGAPLTDWLAA
jgi:REP element-mobilizing transposase RayT